MKRYLNMFALMVLCASFATSTAIAASGPGGDDTEKIEAPASPATMTAADWDAYGERLEKALASDNDGLRQGALRIVIQYGTYMKFHRLAVFDVVRLYRDHRNVRVRRMATVALLQMNDAWAFDFLERSIAFEKNATVKRTILAVLAARPAELPPEARSSSF